MFTARLGSKLSRLGNIVIGFIEKPFNTIVYGQNSRHCNTQNNTRIAAQNMARADDLQSASRKTHIFSSRSGNIQNNRRR